MNNTTIDLKQSLQHPEWLYDATLYEMNVRQLTEEGTLKAATERLDFLRGMGIDAVWLMPIYPIGKVERKGSLGSYYSIRNYTRINPEMGTMRDFDNFVKRAHKLGMKVLLDWVANHTARDHEWLKRCPMEWYEREEDGRAKVPWDWSDTAKLNYANHEVWHGQIEAMRFWVEKHAVDGFRCDMAMLVPIEFWQEAARELRALKPDLMLLAEAEEQNLFEGGTFDACYGWEVHHLMNDIAQQRCRLHPLREWLYRDRERYPRSAVRMTFTSNHDENSWSGSEFERMGAAHEVMSVLSFLWPQSLPLIYTGQEVGYDHSFAFFDRDPIPEESYRENSFTERYRRLIALKKEQRALRSGELGGEVIEIRNNAEDCLMVMTREAEGSRVVAELNLSPYRIHADYCTGIYAGSYRDGLTQEELELPYHVEHDMEPWGYRILVQDTKKQ